MRTKEYLVRVRAARRPAGADHAALPRRGPPHRRDRARRAQAGQEGRSTAAVALIEALATDWDPARYEDRYRERLRDVVSARSKGSEIKAPEEPQAAASRCPT